MLCWLVHYMYHSLCFPSCLIVFVHYVRVWIQRFTLNPAVHFLKFFFFFVQPHILTKSTVNSAFVHCSRTYKFHFLTTFSLKMGPMILFTYLKIILLQCFQFQFSVSAKISSIQTDPMCQFRFLVFHMMHILGMDLQYFWCFGCFQEA